MKTILSIFIAVFISGSVLAQKPVMLKYNLDLNKTYKVKATSTRNQKTTMQGVEQLTDIESASYFSLKALNKGNDFFMAQVKFDSILYSISQPKMEMNSANPGNIKSDKPEEVMDCILNRLCKSTLVVKMAYSGHLIDIMNYDIVAKTILSDIDSLKGQMGMSLKPRIKMMMEKEALKSMIESITVYLPNKEVKKGDTWNTQYTVSEGGMGRLTSTDYTLNELTNDNALLNGEVKIEPSSGKPMEMNGAEITGELRGLGKTELRINPNTGWIISGKLETQISGNMNVKAQGQEFQIPIEIKETSEIKGLE